MTTSTGKTEPWRALPASVADVVEPELPAATGEILAAIAREVPEYARPLEGSFGRGVRTGVSEALRQFVALIRDPDAGRDPGREVYVALGRGELRQGRTIDSLQSAYRVGARVAWRHVAAAARRAGLDPETTDLLAEAIFAYIEELSADSVEGYAQAQAEVEGERQRRRRALARMLLAETPPAADELEGAARAAGWERPAVAAALACPEPELGRVTRRLPADVLAAPLEGLGCVVVPDPDGPGRGAQLARSAKGSLAALGPPGELGELPASWSLARATLRAAESGAIPGDGLVRADNHLAELLLADSGPLAEGIAARCLGALDALTPKARTRLEKTALAYVQQRGNAAAMARVLHVHPQTARYRIARLRELLGEALDDPDSRFELEIGLRARGVALP